MMSAPTISEILEAVTACLTDYQKWNWVAVTFGQFKTDLKKNFGYDLDKFATDNGYQTGQNSIENATAYKMDENGYLLMPPVHFSILICETAVKC